MKTQMMKMSGLFAFVVAMLIGSYAAVAQNTLTWDKLGTEAVDYAIDHDVVTLKGKTETETYSALKIKVINGTVNIHKATVHFANGDTQDIDLPKELNAGNDGKLIDLKGNKRVIEKVTFWYDTKAASNEKAVVEVWGKV